MFCERTRKIKYESPAVAEKALQAVRGRRNKRVSCFKSMGLAIYRCTSCGEYHLGNKPKRVA